MNQHWSGEVDRETVKGAALIDKAFQLIDIVAASPGQISAQKLAQETGWARPTLYRILSAITARGFLRLDPAAQGYSLGYRFLELAQNIWAGPDLAAVASVELRRFRDMTGETTYLGVPHSGAMVALGKFEGTHSVRSSAKLGIRKPMYCTSQGKAVLAFLPAEEVEKILAQEELTSFTPATIIDPAQLRSHLITVRQQGYAIENGEIIAGNRCVGAPIFGNSGKPVAAISVAAPAWRLTQERAELLGPELVAAARNISAQLGGMPVLEEINPAGSAMQFSTGRPSIYGADPMWDQERETLTWTDRLRPSILEMSPDGLKETNLPNITPIRAAGRARANLTVWQSEFKTYWDQGALRDGENPGGNVIACASDSHGKLWTARMEGQGSRISPADDSDTGWFSTGQITSLAWARDGKKLYAADAERGTVYFWERGEKTSRIFSRIPRVAGEPRAIANDGRGRLWVALYDGWGIARLSQDGEIETVVGLPVPRPTGLAFGGSDLRDLYITTASADLPQEVTDHAPLSGHALMLRL